MTDERDQTVVQLGDIKPLLKSGLTCRAYTALSLTEEPYLTLQELGEICGFSPDSLVYNGFLGDLFHAQMVESVPDENDKFKTKVKGYRLTEKARRSMRTVDDELEELAERARKSVGAKKKKPIASGLSVVDGGASEAASNE